VARFEFALPDVGEGLVEAEVVEWLIPVGGTVAEDQAVVLVETAKSIVELPAPRSGVLVERMADVGSIMSVGATVYVIEDGTSTGADESVSARDIVGMSASESSAPAALHSVSGRRNGPRVLASPAVRNRARRLGIDLASVTGSGPSGRIVDADLRGETDRSSAPPTDSSPTDEFTSAPRIAEPVDLVPAPGRSVPLRGLRRAIARSMTESWTRIPHITEFREIDASALVAARAALRAALPESTRLTLLPILARMVVASLKGHPDLNSRLDLDAELIHYPDNIGLGIASSTPDGLIVPVIQGAERKSLLQLNAEVARLGAAAKARRLTPGDTAGGTFTITNFGSFGTWLGTPIIRPPEAAIIGFGRVKDAVVAVDGVPAVRSVLPVAVSADHRVIDGDELAAFLSTVERYVRSPLNLLLEPIEASEW
jgi:pyruvate dehydrogenase E2 component (dihydrolipoamide acetyltransferase)